MAIPYQNPISASQITGPFSVARTSPYGTNFNVLNVGGWQEASYLINLGLTFSGQGQQQLSVNNIPININIGNGTFSPTYLTLNSDNFSSGRRRLGMIVWVNETETAYQYQIDNYNDLWDAAVSANSVTQLSYETIVKNNTPA